MVKSCIVMITILENLRAEYIVIELQFFKKQNPIKNDLNFKV